VHPLVSLGRSEGQRGELWANIGARIPVERAQKTSSEFRTFNISTKRRVFCVVRGIVEYWQSTIKPFPTLTNQLKIYFLLCCPIFISLQIQQKMFWGDWSILDDKENILQQ